MTEQLLSTREAAEYLGIHEKQVYALVKAGKLPATRLTGKWLFPRRLLEEMLERDALRGLAEAREKGSRLSGALLAAGSNDPALDLLATAMRRDHPDIYLFTASTGSTAGLRALDDGHVDIAFSHLLDPETGEYNLPFLRALCPRLSPVAVTIFHRDLGLAVAPGNPRGMLGWADLGKPGVRIVNRQEGAGTRLLLDAALAREGIEPAQVAGYGREAGTHLEAAMAVAAGEADAAPATGSAARLLGLSFVPLAKERFDAVLTRETFFRKPFQALLATLRSPAFRERADRLGHYDLAGSGQVLNPS